MVATRSKSKRASETTTAVATPAGQPSPEPSARARRRRGKSPVVEIGCAKNAAASSAESSDQESAFSGHGEDGLSSSDSESSFSADAEESEPEPTRRIRRRARRQAQSGNSSSDEAEAEAEAKRVRVQTAVEIMPVAQDMQIALGPDIYARLVPQAQNGGSGARAAAKMPRRKNGVKSRKEQLEGDLTDGEDGEDGQVDPRNLPETHIDHSRFSRLFANHPDLRHAWSSLPPPRAPKRIAQPAALKIPLLPFQQEGVQWMVEQEATQFRGGILADEMGMGKTLQTIALLLANGGRPTLVVCPTVALLQWKAEIEMATDALAVFVFYGNDRRRLSDGQGTVNEDELGRYDVVLTTYGVLESSQRREKQGFRQKGRLLHEKSVLHAISWHRVVLDEAHHLKDRSSNTSRAAFALDSQHTWSLTGTPLHNRVGELYALIRLTKARPFCMYFCHSCDCASLQWQFMGSKTCHDCGHRHTYHFSYWNMHVLKPIQDNPINSQASQMGFRKLERLLDSVMLRRTKVERAADMGLPPRIVVTRRDKFSPEEEDLYVSLFSDYQREFDTYAMHGTVLNNYANIFELITRMRLAANHPDLLRLKLSERDRLGSDGRDTLVCSLCSEEAEDPIVSKCHHVFCRLEAHQYAAGAADATALRCPACFALFEIDLAQPELVAKRPQAATATLMESMMTTPSTREYRRSIVNRIDMQRWRSSTKIEALVEELSRLRQGNASIKSIVFSQFVNFLDLIQWRLNRAGFSVCRLDGRMSPTQRDAVIRAFMTKPEFTVFLVSLKAGGVALNLTEASHVYLADCWWNPSVEVQAMDRIHRMGQHRPIKVTRIVIDNSIESRIISLQVKKQLLVSSTIGRDKKSLDRLSEQDMEFLFSS
ncbi:DNA repair protein rad16 [Coemansia sp. RSA 989]|nr:DNA repair protein rad16 [Coemansia sp. RSA 989]